MKRYGMAVVILVSLAGTSVGAQTVRDDRLRSTFDELRILFEAQQPAQARPLIVPPSPLSSNSITTSDLYFRMGLAPSSSGDPLASLQVAPGAWWNNNETATALSLTKDQQRKMDDIFQQHRLRLIDLNASLAKEDAILDPLITAERLDEAKILTQIDRIAQARAELEKANSRMLLAIRQSLTMEQWTKIQSSPQRPKKR